MRKHRCPGGVKVVRFSGMSEVSGSIPVSGLCFLLIFVVYNLSVVLRHRTSPVYYTLDHIHLCVFIVG